MRTILNLSDGERSYPFIYDTGRVYWPEYNPEAFDKHPRYRISFYKWAGNLPTEPISYVIDSSAAVACIPFREDGHSYYQYNELPTPGPEGYYIDFCAIDENGEEDPQYISVQGQTPHSDKQSLYIYIKQPTLTQQTTNIPTIEICATGWGSGTLKDYLMACYGGKDVITKWEMAVTDDDNIYWISEGGVFTDNIASFRLDWNFKHSFEYIDKLKMMAVCKNTIIDGDYAMHVDIRSTPLPITPDLYEFLMAVQAGHRVEDLKNSKFDNMNIIKPRIMDKTVQNVTEITSHSDSKANIIQPVFFRARELAHIVLHPAVTENISINLDAYKSQVDRFYIQVEGTAFSEIGRTEGGVIFKIQGNLLSGSLKTGTYYILNQDSELVTTGKYTYES